ncbi:4-hydroxy-3-methylbut-2-enyl diphosphate reductase [Streptomyces canus]|uniref:4-hydroxy-3-methylbut-2-enyl diphosphate reductase n=1 Tax=Streptomyces canus TaxID=58343 RepID=UPI0027D7E3A4|nr:4-hydroxy-3-methylbut-2-enyl diphosphate reductase [Streptomyces canus]
MPIEANGQDSSALSAPINGKVLLASPRGWCAGVDRAVATVERALEQYGPPVYVRHEIVHNAHVVRSLQRKGAIFVEETDEVPDGEIVIFSAHGVSPAVRQEADGKRLSTIDATCPLVTKVHKEAVRFADDGYDIVLIGHRDHEEVIGTVGEAPHHIQVVEDSSQAENIQVRDPSRLVWLSQTTLSVDEVEETVDAIRSRFPLLESPPSDDICYATQNRQSAVREIAPNCELLLVVGSPNSSNSVRLVEVARESGAEAAYLIDSVDEIDASWLVNVTTVGLTSGASVPELLINEVLEYLGARGYTDVESVTVAAETVKFSLPKELRRDLRNPAASAHLDPVFGDPSDAPDSDGGGVKT